VESKFDDPDVICDWINKFNQRYGVVVQSVALTKCNSLVLAVVVYDEN